MVRIPAKRLGIFPLVVNSPVTNPASIPAPVAASEAKSGLTPWTIRVTATAAPSGKVPSTVMSVMFKMRKLR